MTRFSFRGGVHTVTGLSARSVQLTDVSGGETAVDLAELFTDPSLTLPTTSPRRAPLPPAAVIDDLPDEVVKQARCWEHHLVEVITGVPPETATGTMPKPEYDPTVTTLRQRELAKLAEMRRLGHDMSLSTLQRLRLGYETDGLLGLVDGRFSRPPSVTGRVDDRVLAAVRQAVAEETEPVDGHGWPAPPAGGTDPARRARRCLGDAVAGDVLPAGRAGRPRAPHVRLGAHPAVVGEAAGRPVRDRDSGCVPVSGCRLTQPRSTCGWCWTTGWSIGPS